MRSDASQTVDSIRRVGLRCSGRQSPFLLLVVAVLALVGLTACGSSSPMAPATTGGASDASSPRSSTASAGQLSLDRWEKAYAFLAAQTTPTEIVCGWFTAAGSSPSPAPRPALFYSFSDTAAWKDHLITRNNPPLKGTFEDCSATVPTTVPYGPAIETFLAHYGLTFAADPNATPGLTPIEIAYAGQDPGDPDIVYRDKPGLFGLSMALAHLGKTAFEPGTSTIVQPSDEKTATRYWNYALPLLRWYGYTV